MWCPRSRPPQSRTDLQDARPSWIGWGRRSIAFVNILGSPASLWPRFQSRPKLVFPLGRSPTSNLPCPLLFHRKRSLMTKRGWTLGWWSPVPAMRPRPVPARPTRHLPPLSSSQCRPAFLPPSTWATLARPTIQRNPCPLSLPPQARRPLRIRLRFNGRRPILLGVSLGFWMSKWHPLILHSY